LVGFASTVDHLGSVSIWWRWCNFRIRTRSLTDATSSENLLQISDINALPTGLKAQILDRFDCGFPAAVWTPSDFLDLANRDAVDKTLQCLVKWGGLRRIDRGLYAKPWQNRPTQQDCPADAKAVIDAVAYREHI
jgi:hypothetical protein